MTGNRAFTKTRPAAALIAASLIVAFLVLFVILANTARLGILGFFYEYQHGDKVSHFALYGLLALSLNLALLQLRTSGSAAGRIARVGLVLALFAGLEELSQAFVATRNADVFDLLAGYAGLACGSLTALRLSRGREASAKARGA